MTTDLKKKLPSILGLRDPLLVEENPDKPNLKLSVIAKKSTKDFVSVYEEIYMSECENLFEQGQSYPLTIMYIPIKYMSHAMAYLHELYGATDIAKSNYSALYSGQDQVVFDTTFRELKTTTSRIRLVLSTSITGMGFDPPAICRVIHACPPRSMSQYLQEIGRAGRRGQKSEAILYFNGHDINPNLPGIQPDIIAYCRNEKGKCLRNLLLDTFGFQKNSSSPVGCQCCTTCSVTCTCEHCNCKPNDSVLEDEAINSVNTISMDDIFMKC